MEHSRPEHDPVDVAAGKVAIAAGIFGLGLYVVNASHFWGLLLMGSSVAYLIYSALKKQGMLGLVIGAFLFVIIAALSLPRFLFYKQSHLSLVGVASQPPLKVQAPPTPPVPLPTKPSKQPKHTEAAADLSNAQVHDMAVDLSIRLRQFQRQMTQEESMAMANQWRMIQQAGEDKDAIRKADIDLQRNDEERRAKYDQMFGPLRAESKNMINLLRYRVPPPQPLPNELVSINLYSSIMMGPGVPGAVADYIDQLADLLRVKR